MAAASFSPPAALSDAGELGFRITLAQVRTFLRRYKWVIAGVFLCTVLSAYAALSLTTELYEARAALLVKLGRENLDPPPTARNGVLSTGLRREEIGSEVQILRSADLLDQVVDEIGVESFRVSRVPPPDLIGKVKFYTKTGIRWAKERSQDALIALDLEKRLSERNTIIAFLQQKLTADPQKETDVILLRLRMANPELAVRVEQTLIQKYLTLRVQVRQNRGVKEFFEGEALQLKNALQRAEIRVSEWKQARDLTLPAEQKALLLRQIRELSSQREKATSHVQALTRQMAAAKRLIAGSSERVRATQVETPNAAVQQLRERLTKLETERARLLTTYYPGAAPVRAADEEIATLRHLVEARESTELGSITTELNPLRQQLQQSVNQDSVALEGLSAEASAQERQLAELRRELQQIDKADTALAELDRERTLAEQNYLSTMKRLKDADVESQLDLSRISNVSVAIPPAATLEPVYPRKLLITALSLVVGLLLGVALGIVLEWTSDTVRDEEDVESLTELVCLGNFGADRRRRFSRGGA